MSTEVVVTFCIEADGASLVRVPTAHTSTLLDTHDWVVDMFNAGDIAHVCKNASKF